MNLENNEATVSLDGEITLQRAPELKDLIWSHLQKCKVINFDASKITAWIVKPFSPDQLIAVVKKVLG
jgi:hypothetical protein